MTIAVMTMAALADRLPLKIQSVQCNDPVLVQIGDDWSVALTAPWRSLLKGKMIAWGDKPDPAQLNGILCGNAVVNCDFQGRCSQLDPALILATGHVLEFFSSATLEPWIVRLDRDKIYVAEPSE
jgi:hypothetical protein